MAHTPPPPLLSTSRAAERLRAGAVIAYPTEAVYGLGCDPWRETAVRKILELKDRRAESGLILIGDRYERFLPFVDDVPSEALQRAFGTWPGPVTWLFPRHPDVPDWLAGNHDTIALRVTAHEDSRALCASFGGAVVSTSANASGAEPARDAATVTEYFGDRIDGILEGRLGRSRRPSEIRDLRSGKVLRAA